MGDKDREYWEQLSHLYEVASDLPDKQREKFIENNCPSPKMKEELTTLIEVDKDSTNYFDSLSSELIQPAFDELSDLPPASGKVHNYKILQKVGRGGMGSVYLAERSDKTFESKVAVKILRRGLDSEDILERFKIERQILAQLNHPNITHLLDGGITSDGRPYFVMEYVEGKPITDYCDDNKLTIRERLQLFLRICDALTYAHQNLVIHRDLKPGNIFVTKNGLVKLLDFGIANLLNEKTGYFQTHSNTGHRFMTPEYSSPEQIKGSQINTASDIYQLGLVLYELLVGQTPFILKDKSLAETERIILEEKPVKPCQKFNEFDPQTAEKISKARSSKPKQVKNTLKGDLDTIILKTLHKNPERRFSSVFELREDIQRFLDNQPVLARGDSFSYRAKKFVIRNKVSASLVAGLIVLIITFTFLYNHSITEQRNQAQQEAVKASQVTSFLIDLFEANDPTLTGGEDLTAWELLEYGEERIEVLEGQPEIQAQMFDVTGQIYRKIGEFEKAENLLTNALNIRKDLFEENHPVILSNYDKLGLLLSDQGRFTEADSVLRHALQIREKYSNLKDPSAADTKSNLAYVLRRTGNYDEAEEMYRRSLDIRRQAYGNRHELTIESMSSLGVTLLNLADYVEAERIFREVLDLRKEILSPAHPDLAMSYNNLGALLLLVGNFEEAITMFRESLDMRKQLFGDMHPKVALTTNNLAIALGEQGDFENSVQNFEEALSIRKTLFEANNVNTAISLFSYGLLKLRMEQPNEALMYVENAYDIFLSQLSKNHSFTARSMMAKGEAHLLLGNHSLAEEYIEKGFIMAQQIHEETSLELALAQWDYAKYLFKTDQDNVAIHYARQALNNLQAIEGPGSVRQTRIIEELSSYGTDLLTETF